MKNTTFGCLIAAGLMLAGSLLHAADLTAPTTTNPTTTTPTDTTTTDTSTTTTTTTTPTTTPETTTPSTSSVTIQTTHGTNGTFLTDSTGHSLYLFEIDNLGKSNCTGACAKVWHPVTVADVHATATVSGDANSTLVGTPITRDDGMFQVTYNGLPLYTYAGDNSAGDTNGQGKDSFGGHWFLVKPDGTKLTPTANPQH